jgi:hypothetical protein
MQISKQNTALGKRAAPEDIATQPKAKIQKLAQPTVSTECLFLNKLAQELRDHIYDYVAMTETKIGAHVTFKGDSDVKVHAHSRQGLSHTCRQIRQEYSLRLERRIRDLVVEFRDAEESTATPRKPIRDPGPRKMSFRERMRLLWFGYIEPPVPSLDHSAKSHTLKVAERQVTRGVYIQEDVAYTMRIPFGGIYDSMLLPFPGVIHSDLRLSTLTVTFATSPPRTYNTEYDLDASRDEAALWTAKNRYHTLVEAVSTLLRSSQGEGWDDWHELFWRFQILFPRREGEKGNMLKGRTDKDHWWKTLDGRFMYRDDE